MITVKTPSGRGGQGAVEAYGLGDKVTMYVVRGAGEAKLGGTVAVVSMDRVAARELMGQLAKALDGR